YKNFSAELPGDFAGGFVKIQTLDMPTNNGFQIGYGIGFRTNSVFRSHLTYSKSGLDVMGAGTGTRTVPREFPSNLNNVDLAQACKYAAQLPNNWDINKRVATPDQSLSFSFNNTKKIKALTMTNMVYFGYSYHNDQAILENNQFGIYNIQAGESAYSKKYNDTVYQENSKINVGYNLCFFTQNGHKIRFKNLLQNMGTNKTGFREGINYSNNYHEKSQEFFYRNRLTYATQLESSHNFKNDHTSQLDWALGYAYVLNNEPDRRIMDARKNVNESSPYFGMYRTMDNDVRRFFQYLTEHSSSANINYNHLFNLEKIAVGIKTGLYAELKTRDFNARNFTYKKSIENDLTPEYFYLPYPEMFDLQYLSPRGFYLAEGTGKSDSYNSLRSTNAAYALLRLEFFNLALHTGLRLEQSFLTLNSYTSDGVKPVNLNKNMFNVFPSVNLSYTIKEKHVLRTAYGITINRPEFREIAPFVYYDFETFSTCEGNPDLKDATIHNVDLRYEFYPNKEEMISLGAFYKKFINPIENTFYYAGGQFQYTYMNAHSAVSYGLELDIRKSLDFMKLKNFSLVLNASLLKSGVIFPKGSIELNRAMQGQSPFIVNAGLYYDNKRIGLTFSVLYNIIGKRIEAVGQANQNANENIPNTYQMPRHSLDASIQQKIGKFKLYVSARNILNQKVIYTQIGSYTTENKNAGNYRQNTKVIKSGVQINTGFTVNF
ncbi:MAG: TonB-dependent receptor, partial [Lentimicrobiaceae bacterium]|nr:TonB-dependent receptor [Lentimicrobiaceae bacterium]